MAGKPLRKHGVIVRQLAEDVPEGCSLPDFEQKPVTMALAEGRNAIFRAVVCGDPSPEVHWENSKGELSNSSKYQISSAPGSKDHALQINKLTGEDTDVYRCVAVNLYGEAVCSARLTVIEVGFRKKRKREEPQQDLRQELMGLRNMLRAPPPTAQKIIDPQQVWQLLLSADRKDYERLCIKYGIVDFRGMLRKLEKMRREREEKMAQYVHSTANMTHIAVSKEGVASFEMDLDLKDPQSKISLCKDGEEVPFGSDDHAKHSLQQLGKHYSFQIQDVRPEDAGIYEVKVEDVEIFTTELEADTIPPSVVVPLTETRCEEGGNATFQCVLSNSCPSATWKFQHRPLQPSDKYEVFVSPDGQTHQLVVKGVSFSDTGPYSLDTGLQASTAWLVVEAGKDKGLLPTGANHQVQAQGDPTTDVGESRIPSGQGGEPREQGPAGGTLKAAGWASGLEGGSFGGHGQSLTGDNGAAWGLGQAGNDFLEADGHRATLFGEDQLHRGRDWDRSLEGRPRPQGEGAGSGLGRLDGHQLQQGRNSDGDQHGGSAGGWGSGSQSRVAGGPGGSREGQGHSKDNKSQLDKDSQGQLWGAQLGPGAGKRALQGWQPGPMGSGPEGEGLEKLQQEGCLGQAGGSFAAGGLGALESPESRGSSSKAGRGPEAWGSQGQGEAQGFGGPGQSVGQTPAGQDFSGPAVSGGRSLLGRGSAEGSRQEANGWGPGEPVGEGRGYRPHSEGLGGPGGWTNEDQGALGALSKSGDGRSLHGSLGRTAGQKGAEGGGRMEAGGPGPWGDAGCNLSQAGAYPGPGVQGSGGGREGMAGAQASGLVRSGQRGDASNYPLTGSPNQGAQGPWGTLGGKDGAGGQGATGPGPDSCNGTWSFREGGPRGGMGSEAGLVGLRDSGGLGHFRGTGPQDGAGYHEASSMLGMGSAPRPGAPGGAGPEKGGGHGDGSQVPGDRWAGNQDGSSSAQSRLGTPAGLQGGPEGARVHPETWGESRARGGVGPGGKHPSDGGLGSLGTVGPGGRGGLGDAAALDTAAGGHVGAEQGASGRREPWGSPGDGEGFRASGAMGASGEGGSGGPGVLGPGSLGAGDRGRDGTKGLGAGATGAGAGHWEESRHPQAQAPDSGVSSDSQGPGGPGHVPGYREGSRIPGPQHVEGRTGSGGEARGLGPGGAGSGAEVGFRDGPGSLGGMGSGSKAGHRGGTGGAGDMGSVDGVGHRDALGASKGMGSGSEAGHGGGSGGSAETGPESEKGHRDGPGGLGLTGSLAAGAHEGGPRGREAQGPGSGNWGASEGPYGDASSTGDPKRGRGPGLVDGAGPGLGSGVPGVGGATAGQGSRVGPGGRGASIGEGESADQAGGVGASGSPDGWGAVDRDAQAGTAAPGSRHEGDSRKAGPGTAGRQGAAGQGGPGPQGMEGSLGGGKVAEASRTGTGQDLDSSQAPRERGRSVSDASTGPGLKHARGVGRKDQGSERGHAGAGAQPPSSRGQAGVAGQGEAGVGQGPGLLDSKASAPGRDRSAGLRDLDGARNGLEGPLGGKDSGDRSRDIGGLGSQLGRGQRGDGGPLGKPTSLETETDKTQGPGALKEDKGQGVAETGGRSRTQRGTKLGASEGQASDEARGKGQQPGGGDAGDAGESLREGRSREPSSRLGGRRGHTESKLDIDGQGEDATRSPRSRRKPGAGSLFEEAQGPRGHFSQGLADTEARLGEAAVLSCILSRDLGPGAWFKDGVKLSAQDGLVLEQDALVHKLLIAHVEETHAGRYTFEAGGQKSEATLTVRDPPVIAPDVMERLKEPLVVKAGKPLAVKVAFQSRLPVQASWTKDGTQVDGTGGRRAQVALSDDFTRLCLPSVSRKDSGRYTVTLRSKGGSAQADVTVQVIDKSQPPQGPLEVQHCRGTGICLRWRPPRDDGGRAVDHYVVERQQTGRSTWLKVGEPPADSTSFTDAHVERGKKYAFRVRAVTSEGPGEALASEEVLVGPEALPGPPSAPTILSASSKSISLTWTGPRGPGSAHLLGYLIDKRKKGSNTWTAVTDQPVAERKWTVMDLRPDCQYEFRVTAVAASGPGQPGPPSDAVFARDPMRPPGPVRDLQVTETSHTSISLRWAQPASEDGDGAQGYVVELCASDSLEWTPAHTGTVLATTYTAKGLRPREGYFVRVVAVNEGGRSPPTALDMLVHAAPVSVCPKFLIDSSMKDSLMVRVGDTVRVPVPFEAAPMPEVTWLKDGLLLPRRYVTSTEDGLTQLLVPVASLADSGTYTVMLRGQQGEEATYTFFLRVAVKPMAPGPITLKENVPGTVTAEWEPSPSEAKGVPLHYTVLTRCAGSGPWREAASRVYTHRFTLLGVLPGREYYFRVVAKNELGASEPSDTSQPWCLPRQRGTVTVKAPSHREPSQNQKPWFAVGLRSHLLPAGCECRMSCAVRGWPPPRVTWFRNGENLEGSPTVYSTDTLGVCSLVIASVSPEDSGLYKAVAENTLGQAISTATLLVIDSSS